MRKMSKMIQLSEFDAIFQEREGQEEKQMGEEARRKIDWGERCMVGQGIGFQCLDGHLGNNPVGSKSKQQEMSLQSRGEVGVENTASEIISLTCLKP